MKKKYNSPIMRVVALDKEEVVRTSGLDGAPLNSGCTFYDRHHFFDGSGFGNWNFVS